MIPKVEYVETPFLLKAKAAGPQDIPGSECIGNGYDIFEGDYASPLSTKYQLFDLTKKEERQIDESHTYNVPTSLIWKPLRKGESRTVTGKTIEEHQSQLSVGIGVSGGYGGFKGSLDANFDRNTLRRSSLEYATHIDRIQKWELKLPDEPKDLLLPDVEDKINSLPPIELFDRFGTHYLSKIIVGARATYSSAVDTVSYKSNFALNVVAEMSYKSLVGSINVDMKAKYEQSVSNFQSNSISKVRVFGGDPAYANEIANGKYDNWIASTDERPVFMDFGGDSLRPIWELCRDESRRSALEKAYPDYAKEKTKPLPKFPLTEGDLIALQADNGNYLNRREPLIEAAKQGIDQSSRFKVTVLEDEKIALQADTGLYWKVEAGIVTPTGSFVDKIAIDIYSKFKVEYVEEEGKIALQGYDGNYLSRVGPTEIKASKKEHDVHCDFSVYIL